MKILKKYKKIQKNKGAAMLISVIFFLFISLAIISGLVSPSISEFKNANRDLNSKKSFFLAESGTEDAFYRLKNVKTIGDSVVLNLGGNSVTTNITDSGYNQKTIISTGDVFSLQRKSNAVVSAGAGVGFNYGIQAGTGGFSLSGGSKITGNVYSNGNILAYSGVQITGSAIASGATSYIGDGDGVKPNPYAGTAVIGTAGAGDAWAYNSIGSTVAGNLYCQTGSLNNKVCNTSKGIPPVQAMPFTEEDIAAWKSEGEAGNIITGATKCPGGFSGGNCTVNYANATFGPGKITGNLIVNGGGTLTLTGTVWVQGTVTVTGGGKIKLPTNFAQYSATIISDGIVLLNGGSYTGSGTLGSYLFVVTTSSSSNAMTVSGGSGAIAVCAQNGTVALSGGIDINAAVGKTITAIGGTDVVYQQGLASPSFNNGPSGGWNLSSWKETQ